MVTSDMIIRFAKMWIGKPYVFGAEVSQQDKDPKAFDCSELVEYTVKHMGLPIPDGAENQYQYCKKHKTLASLSMAKNVAGMLVFRFDPKQGRMVHVGITDGKGMTMEARGAKWGCGMWEITDKRGWTHCAFVPGVIYNP